MSEIRKTYEGGTFFVTMTIVGWIDVFNREFYCEEIIKNLQYCQANKGLELYAYCLMASHLHMIASVKSGTLGNLLRDFKSYTAKQVIKLIENNPQESRREWLLHLFKYYAKFNKHNALYQFWQQNNHAIDLYSNAVIDQKIEYIHQNPVVAGIVTDATYYKYSSANPESILKTIIP